MVKFKSISLKIIADSLDLARVGGSAELTGEVDSLAEPKEAITGSIIFLINESYLKEINDSKASYLVVQESLLEKATPLIPKTLKNIFSVKDAYCAFAKMTALIAKQETLSDWRLSHPNKNPLAIHETATIDPSVQIGANVIISENAKIGARTILLPNCVIGPSVEIGTDCVIFPGVVIYPKTKIGNHVRIHANAVIGSDGFGFARGKTGPEKIWHLGSVQIHDRVEIGAGTTIDRGTIKDTVIEMGAQLDNQVQVGHNVHVKAFATLCAQVGLAGNAKVGKGAILAGKVGVGDKISVGDGAMIGGMTGVSKDIPANEIWLSSMTARPRKEWWRTMVYLDRISELFDRVKKIEGGSK